MKHKFILYILYSIIFIVSSMVITCDMSGLFTYNEGETENQDKEDSNPHEYINQNTQKHPINTSTIFSDNTRILFIQDTTVARMNAEQIYTLKITNNKISVMLRPEDIAYYRNQNLVFTFKFVSAIESVSFYNDILVASVPSRTILQTSDGNSHLITIDYEDIQDETRIMSISASANNVRERRKCPTLKKDENVPR